MKKRKRKYAANCKSVWMLVMLTTLIYVPLAGNATADEVTYEGTIQGLNCTYYTKNCPTEDLDIYAALEDDFVLVRPDGAFFLLPNLSTLVKARHLTENVRVRGTRDGSSIWVENLEVKKNGDYETVWNLQKQEAKRVKQ